MNMELLQRTEDELLEEFYSKKWYLSYSALKLLLYHAPAFYEKYIKGQKEDSTEKHLINGKLIHCLMLEKEKYDQKFALSPSRVPEGNSKEVVMRVFKKYINSPEFDPAVIKSLEEFEEDILQILLDLDLHQSLTDDKLTKTKTEGLTGNQKRLNKILTEDNINYFDFLVRMDGKDIIDQEQLTFCNSAVEALERNYEVSTLLGRYISDFDKASVMNEKLITVDLNGYDFGLKGVVDNYVILHDQKLILVNDIKNISKELRDFEDSCIFFSYWMQAAIYVILIYSKYKHLFNEGYELEFRFIVIDKNLQVYPFKVKEMTLSRWRDKLEDSLKKAKFHYDNRSYGLPYEFANGLVEL